MDLRRVYFQLNRVVFSRCTLCVESHYTVAVPKTKLLTAGVTHLSFHKKTLAILFSVFSQGCGLDKECVVLADFFRLIHKRRLSL